MRNPVIAPNLLLYFFNTRLPVKKQKKSCRTYMQQPGQYGMIMPYLINPFALASFRQAYMPFLFMVRMPLAETFSVTQRFSSGMKNRFS